MICPECGKAYTLPPSIEGRFVKYHCAEPDCWYEDRHSILSPAELDMVESIIATNCMKGKLVIELNSDNPKQQALLQKKFNEQKKEIANAGPVLAAIMKKIEENKS